MELTHFKPYQPTDYPFGQDVVYLQSAEGKDWYQVQSEFSPTTLKVMYDDTGKILAQSKDISTLFPLNASVTELDTDKADVIGLYIKNGQVVSAPPSAFHSWNGHYWDLTAEQKERYLSEQRTRLLTAVATKTDTLKNQVLLGYPQTEIDSFYRQEREARAWLADNTSDTPMLNSIAEKRGVPLALLAQKVVEKAEQLAVIIGDILGEKQRFEDRLNAVKNIDEFASLEQEITQWTLNLSI